MRVNNWFDFLKITLASPAQIVSWATSSFGHSKISGQITNSELLVSQNLRPASSGLFCEKIFGPIDSTTCWCGKSVLGSYKMICPRCKSQKVSPFVRRYRMGYIKLVLPVVHIWYISGASSFIGLLLNLDRKTLEQIIYYSKVPRFPVLKSYLNTFAYDSGTGASFLKSLLTQLNLKLELFRCRLLLYLSVLGYSKVLNLTYSKHTLVLTREKVLKKIRLLENFISSKSHPSWMILDNLPVLPPLLRPLLSDSQGLILAELNTLYLNIINANFELSNSINSNLPRLMRVNEHRHLQESVDFLIDKSDKSVDQANLHTSRLQSLSLKFRGKFGRFRFNLLGKRVNSSGRSVITVGPSLKLNQCGLPFKLARKLFEPFLIRHLFRFKLVNTFDSAKDFLTRNTAFVWILLTRVLKHNLILLNRAPTLHRLGLQAFEPLLISGDSILFPPVVCNSFNADFDGDQMSVYLPLTKNAQYELQTALYTPNNLLSITTGTPIFVPSHEIIIGANFLTLNDSFNFSKYYTKLSEIQLDFIHQLITLHTLIWFKASSFISLELGQISKQFPVKFFNSHKYILTTLGRLLLHKTISKALYT